ncbi:MAG: lysylphosphatidylglycerol synthase transmembrane domain-containing protein, partial [Solirubrobacteraceae bacterium]
MSGVLISVLSLAGVVWWASHQPAPRLPSRAADLALVLLALCTYAAITTARAWRWYRILRGAAVESSFGSTLELVVIGYMGNTVLPLRGGEVLRVLLLARASGAGYPRAIGTIVPERLLDLAALTVVFVPLTAIGVAGSPAGDAPAIAAAALVVLGGLGLLCYLRLRAAGRFARFAERVRPLTTATRELLHPRGAALLALSLAIWLAEALVFFLVATSLQLGISLPEGLYVVIAASFVALIPAGPGFAGTFDGAVLFALKALDVGGGLAVSCLVLYR